MGTWHVKLRSDIAPDAISASQVSLDNLWNATSPSKQFFDRAGLMGFLKVRASIFNTPSSQERL
jgi:hypothetical protein